MQRCWETFDCKETACPGHSPEGIQCWLISGNHCRETMKGKFLEKMEMCLECDIFRENINPAGMQETFQEIRRQFKEIRKTADLNDGDLRTMSLELAISLSEVFDALKKISAGDPEVRIPEQSNVELISLLKHFVNLTAKNIGEMVDQCHEFAFCLATHFEVLHRVSKGDLSIRVEDISQLEIFQSLRKLTNEAIESITKEMSERKQVEKALKLNEERVRTLLKLEKMKMSSDQDLVQFSLEEGVRLTGSTIGYLLFVDEEKNGTDLCLWSREVVKICSAQGMSHSFLDKAGIWGESIRSRKPVIQNDFQNTPGRKGYPENHSPITRYMSIPVFDESKIVAAVGVANKEYPYNEFDVMHLALLMNSMWRIIKQKKVEYELQKYHEHLEELVEERTENLQQTRKRLQFLLASTPAVIYTTQADKDYRTTFISENIVSLLGYEPHTFLDQPHFLVTHIHPDDMQKISNRLLQFSGIGQHMLDYRCKHMDGSYRWMLDEFRLLRDETGNPVEFIGSWIDITERKRREHEMETMISFANSLRAAQNKVEMLPIILDQVMDLLKAEGASLAIRDTVSGRTVIELARGEWASLTGQSLPTGEGICGHVISTGQSYSNETTGKEQHFFPSNTPENLHAIAASPLIAQGITIGALLVGRKTAIAPYEVRLLTAIGDTAANAIQRADLHEQTLRRLDRLAALHTIDMAITSSLDLRVTLNVLLDQVSSQLGAHASSILLLDPFSQTLEYVAGRGFRSRAIQQTRLKLGEGHAGCAALEHRIVSVADVHDSNDPCVRGQQLTGEVFVSHHAAPLIAKGQVKGVLEIFYRFPFSPDPEWLEFFESLAAQAAIALDNAELFNNLQHSNVQLTMAYDATIQGLSRALDSRDNESEGHSRRVANLAVKIGHIMGMSDDELVHVRRGALLHDIGKIGVPDALLLKPEELSEEERLVIKRHPLIAYEMLSDIPFLRNALDIPFHHHEKWDGTGYPHGLRGEQIPLAARIFAIVDAWDALCSARPHRSALSQEKAREYTQQQSGKHFDPRIVKLFIGLDLSEDE
jgi:PAS domain S-box-containing protein